MPAVRPVFIVGAGRSGTTPLQLAINMHPQLGVYGETQAFFVHRKFGAEPGEKRLRPILRHWGPMVASCCPYDDLLEGDEIRSELAHAASYAQLVDLIFGAMAGREGKSRWGEKSPAHIFRLAEIRSCFPKAQIIHIIRDPRAVVSSAIQAFGGGEFSDWNVFHTAKYWLRCFEVHANRRSKPSDGSYLLLRYEDFVAQPEHALRGVSSFLGIDFVPRMLQAHRVASKYVQKESSGSLPAHHVLTQKPLNASRAEAWKKTLSPKHTTMIEEIAGKQMQTLGYEPAARREYQPPRMRTVYFSSRWIAAEGRRIADKQARSPYWALQRIFQPREQSEPAHAKTAPAAVPSPKSRRGPKGNAVPVRAHETPDQIRRSGT